MTYGFLPENWPAFRAELEKRRIGIDDIEKVEIRPDNVIVTLRSGQVESWERLGT